MTELPQNTQPWRAEFFGCIGAMASVAVVPFLGILILITNPASTPAFDKLWNWASLGLAILNTVVCFSVMKSFSWVKVAWVVASSVVIVVTCPHFWS